MEYRRPQVATLMARLAEPRRFLQVVAGPRQVGKTTLVLQVLDAAGLLHHYASADQPTLRDAGWIAEQWEIGRVRAADAGEDGAVVVLDEIQKIPGWSEAVKRLWDEDTRKRLNLKAVLLGSSPLLVQRGLSESLAGRFEVLRLPHWSFPEMKEAFGFSVDEYVFYGGYPGAAPLIDEPERWSRYLLDSLIETTIARDVLLVARVDKPALLRQLFELACLYSGQVLSYNKMLGQLHDAGNATTLAHYLDLLAGAGMVMGLQKYAGSRIRQRGSIPKLQVLNTALTTAQSGRALEEAKEDPTAWGRLVESAVGAHVANAAFVGEVEAYYWRERDLEVDFVVRAGPRVAAIEVKSGARRQTAPGMDEFARRFRTHRRLLVGEGGIPVKEFLARGLTDWTAK